MDDLDQQLRTALRQLDRQSDQATFANTHRRLSAENIAAVATNRNRRRNLAFTVLTVAATAVLWNWQQSNNNPIADTPPAAASPTLAQSIDEFLEESRALREETEKLLAESRQLTARDDCNDPFQNAATFAVGHANFRIDNGDDTEQVRQDLESVVDSYPNTFGASEAKKILAQLPKPTNERPAPDASGKMPVPIRAQWLAKR